MPWPGSAPNSHPGSARTRRCPRRPAQAGLRVPLEEHLLVMAPPRTFKTAFLADVIVRYPGPVITTSTKPDLYALTSAVRAQLGPDRRTGLPSAARKLVRSYQRTRIFSGETRLLGGYHSKKIAMI
jgi:hypothetical protein